MNFTYIISIERNTYQGDIDRSIYYKGNNFFEAMNVWKTINGANIHESADKNGNPTKYFEFPPVRINGSTMEYSHWEMYKFTIQQ